MTLLGTGEKALSIVSTPYPSQCDCFPRYSLRDSVIRSHVVVRIVVRLTLDRSLLSDHVGVAQFAGRRITGGGGGTSLLATSGHARVVTSGLATDEDGRALGKRRAGRRTQRRGCESLKGRHGVWLCVCEGRRPSLWDARRWYHWVSINWKLEMVRATGAPASRRNPM